MIAAIDIIGDDRNDKSDCNNVVVSIYFEWPTHDFGCVKGKISVTQIGANLSNGKRHLLVIPFDCHTNNKKLLIWLQQLLAQVNVAYIGRIFVNDIAKLKKDYQIVSFSLSNVVDIGTTEIHRGLATKKGEQQTCNPLLQS